MNRVVVSRAMVGIYGMQVCACKDASDDEILNVCNTENPAGTSNGWTCVIRDAEREGPKCVPAQCADDPERMHFLVTC